LSKTPFVCNWNNHLITYILLLNGDHLLKPQTANTLRVWRIQQYCGFFVWFLTLMKQRLALAYLTFICESSIIRKCRDCGWRASAKTFRTRQIYYRFRSAIYHFADLKFITLKIPEMALAVDRILNFIYPNSIFCIFYRCRMGTARSCQFFSFWL
jgi:hypothetical protein